MGRRKFNPDNPHPEDFRQFFLYWTEPPYACGYCGEHVDHELKPYTLSDSLVIHHIDFSHANITLPNLMPLHRKCHPSVHITGMKRSEEARANMRMAQSLSYSSGRAAPFAGKSHTDEVKAVISEKALTRASNPVPCPECEQLLPVHTLPNHIRSRHTGEPTHSEEGMQRLRDLGAARLRKRIWCEECNREWSVPLWPRHIRKYHEGGTW